MTFTPNTLSEMNQRIRAIDWEKTSFGAEAGWPQELRMALSLCLNTTLPTALYWGKIFVSSTTTPGRRLPGKSTRGRWGVRPARSGPISGT